jgi:hypothetical protein
MKHKRSVFIISFIISVTICFSQSGLLSALDVPPVQKKRIAVLEINTSNISSSFGNIARNNFEVLLFNSDKFQLLDRERQKAVAAKLGLSPDSSNSIEDLLQFGKNLSADYLVSGTIDKLDVYKITMRVISVSNGEIITVQTQSFTSTDEFDATVNIVSVKIKDNLVEYIRDGKIQKPFFEQHGISADLSFNYFIPVSNFRNLIDSGPGITGRCEISNIFFDNDFTGLHAGYYWFKGKKNNRDEASFTILQLAYGYKYNLFRRLYFKGDIEGGMNLVALHHAEGNGFYMADNSRKKAIDPIAQIGFFAGVTPVNHINLETGASYGINFERGGNLYFLNLSIGLSANF